MPNRNVPGFYRFLSPVRDFIRDSRAVGIILIGCTVLSILMSNGAWSTQYTGFWNKQLHIPIPGSNLPHSVLHTINDGLMALFFFLVGLEIKREFITGELSGIRKSMLPVVAAIGGMVVPAAIYALWCGNSPYSRGWGIPIATDIAFSLGVLSLLGTRAPLSLKIFLTALAIIDDLGGILTIAIFYTASIHWLYICLSLGLLAILTILNLLKFRNNAIYLVMGVLLWYCVYNSGVHATIAGVLLAFTIPLHKIERLEHWLHRPVNFVVLPLFALANTAIVLPSSFEQVFTSFIHHGVVMGLVIGKPAGIFLFSLLAVRLGIADLPAHVGWKHILGVGMIAGIGFTISIFISTLAFANTEWQLIAKVAVIGASLLSGILGYCYLRMLDKNPKK